MDGIDAAEVRAQLDRIVGSTAFARSVRMRKFLTFVVEEGLAGRAGTLKENVIAHHVYGRSIDFDGGDDPIVRVDARRLRDKLREYYTDHPDESLRIELPKGGYAPVFVRRADSRGVPGAPRLPARRFGLLLISLSFLLAIGAWLWWPREPSRVDADGDERSAGADASPPRAVPLTSFVGREIHPSLSPDGSQLAFAWNGGARAGFDIYVKVIGDDQALPLTRTEVDELYPSWSPDGRWIAFVRESRSGSRSVHVVSPLGSGERKIIDSGYDISWSPDSESIVFSIDDPTNAEHAIYRLTMDTREVEQLTFPERSAVDFCGVLAPGGDTLAFIRCATAARQNCDVFVKAAAEDTQERRLTTFDLPSGGLAWTPDGRELVLSVFGRLYRVRAAPGAEPRDVGIEGSAPSIAASAPSTRLAFQQTHADSSIWRTQIVFSESSEPVALGASAPHIDSTRGEVNPVPSPDGSTIVFASDRGGAWTAWAADADGRRVRPFSEHINGQFRWSPDGRQVAGLCVDQVDDRNDICIVDTETGHAVEIAASAHADGMPFWSSDGSSIYFSSDRSGQVEIWTVGLQESQPTQLTSDGGLLAGISSDRTGIFYYRDPVSVRHWPQALWRLSLESGVSELVLDPVYPFAHVDAPSGLYWLDFDEGRRDPPRVMHRSNASSLVRPLGRLTHPVVGLFPELAVSSDESFLYTSGAGDGGTDILMIVGLQ